MQLANIALDRWSPIMYTDSGRKLIEGLWGETLQELGIEDIKKIIGPAAH